MTNQKPEHQRLTKGFIYTEIKAHSITGRNKTRMEVPVRYMTGTNHNVNNETINKYYKDNHPSKIIQILLKIISIIPKHNYKSHELIIKWLEENKQSLCQYCSQDYKY